MAKRNLSHFDFIYKGILSLEFSSHPSIKDGEQKHVKLPLSDFKQTIFFLLQCIEIG